MPTVILIINIYKTIKVFFYSLWKVYSWLSPKVSWNKKAAFRLDEEVQISWSQLEREGYITNPWDWTRSWIQFWILSRKKSTNSGIKLEYRYSLDGPNTNCSFLYQIFLFLKRWKSIVSLKKSFLRSKGSTGTSKCKDSLSVSLKTWAALRTAASTSLSLLWSSALFAVFQVPSKRFNVF